MPRACRVIQRDLKEAEEMKKSKDRADLMNDLKGLLMTIGAGTMPQPVVMTTCTHAPGVQGKAEAATSDLHLAHEPPMFHFSADFRTKERA